MLIRNVLLLFSFIFLSPAFAGKINYDGAEALSLNYAYRPMLENSYQLKDDKQKTLSKLQNQTNEWQRQSEFVNNWNLESSGMYTTSEHDQKQILLKTFSRYSERRTKEYINSKRNKKSGNDNQVGPDGTTLNSKGSSYYLSYHTVILKGRARLQFHNPYLQVYSQYSFSDKDEMVVSRTFQDYALKTSFLYSPLREISTMSVEKYLTDNIMAKVSNINFVENKIELVYTSTFF